MDCKSCASLNGTQRISPGPPIYKGRYWTLEHSYPTRLMGWLVLVLNRHAIALHELTVEEFTEFHLLIPQIITLLQIKFSSTKEYILCLAEKEGFEHVHVHFVPRAADLPDEFKGTKIFSLMGEDGRIPEVDVAALCRELQELF